MDITWYRPEPFYMLDHATFEDITIVHCPFKFGGSGKTEFDLGYFDLSIQKNGPKHISDFGQIHQIL